jgi:hypothetical protein
VCAANRHRVARPTNAAEWFRSALTRISLRAFAGHSSAEAEQCPSRCTCGLWIGGAGECAGVQVALAVVHRARGDCERTYAVRRVLYAGARWSGVGGCIGRISKRRSGSRSRSNSLAYLFNMSLSQGHWMDSLIGPVSQRSARLVHDCTRRFGATLSATPSATLSSCGATKRRFGDIHVGRCPLRPGSCCL